MKNLKNGIAAPLNLKDTAGSLQIDPEGSLEVVKSFLVLKQLAKIKSHIKLRSGTTQLKRHCDPASCLVVILVVFLNLKKETKFEILIF